MKGQLLAATLASWQDFTVTAYAHGCTNTITGIEPATPQKGANNRWPEPNWTIAAPPEFPHGTVLMLSHAGIVTTRIVGDRGRAIKGRRLDLFMESCERAIVWGKRRVSVEVVRIPLGKVKADAPPRREIHSPKHVRRVQRVQKKSRRNR